MHRLNTIRQTKPYLPLVNEAGNVGGTQHSPFKFLRLRLLVALKISGFSAASQGSTLFSSGSDGRCRSTRTCCGSIPLARKRSFKFIAPSNVMPKLQLVSQIPQHDFHASQPDHAKKVLDAVLSQEDPSVNDFECNSPWG